MGIRKKTVWALIKASPPYIFLLIVVVGTLVALASGRSPDPVTGALYVSIVFFISWLMFPSSFWHPWNIRRAHQWGLGLWAIDQCKEANWWQWLGRGELSVIETYDTEFLKGAYFCPDHTRYAKTEIKHELRSRGMTDLQIEEWLPPANAIAVPLANPLHAFVGTFEPLHRLRSALRIAALLSVISGLIALRSPSGPILEIARLATEVARILTLDIVHLPFSSTEPAQTLLSIGLIFFVLSMMLGALKSQRVLLLRPFGERQLTRALQRVVLKNLATRAHVFTLSDKNFTPRWWITIWDRIVAGGSIVASVFFRPSVRIASVTDERGYLNLAVALRGHVWLGFWSGVNGGQAFNIKTSYSWWQQCIDMLMHSTNLIVMDISRVGHGSAWEIIQLDIRERIDRCVFIVHDDYAADAKLTLEKYLQLDEQPRVHVYGTDGRFLDSLAFHADRAAKARR